MNIFNIVLIIIISYIFIQNKNISQTDIIFILIIYFLICILYHRYNRKVNTMHEYIFNQIDYDNHVNELLLKKQENNTTSCKI